MDPIKIAMALEATAAQITQPHTHIGGVPRYPQDTDVSYALRVLAENIRRSL